MKLEQYRTLWGNIDIFDGLLAGSPHHDIDTLLPHLASLGYDGVEMPFKLALFLGPERLKSLLTQYDMHLTLSIYTDSTFNAGSPELEWWGGTHQGFTPPITAVEMAAALVQRTERHEAKNAKGHYEGSYEALEEEQPDALLQILERHVTCFKEEAAACYQIFGDRREGGLLTLVVAHDLRDNFPWAIAARYFRDILPWEKQHGFVVAHETHRKRFLHSPWAIRDFFLKYPDIRAQIGLCADYSHLLCVAEVDTSDPVLNQVIDFLAPNVVHTQCRVGYDHGPQVPDPRSPEWIHYTEGMERWWDTIWQSQLARGYEYTTMIAEHGPPTYQMCVPGSQQPLADIWDVNHWVQLQRQRRFEQLFGADHQSSKLVQSETQGYEPNTNSSA
jgi:sugar phosphate isomerase/epimerase